MSTIMAVQHLSAGYGRTTIINEQTLTIEAGVITGLIGPNGSGKSTLLNVMNGFRAPLAGRVLLKDRPLSTFNHKQRAAEIACLTQHPVAPEGITVAELVSYGRYCHSKGLGWLRRRDQISVTEAISTVHLTAFKDTLVSELSGGQRQRAFIAMTLAQNSPIMMLDEPTTYLDLPNQLETLALLRQLNQVHKKTIIVVLHDLNQAATYCDQLVCMTQGRVNAVGTPKAVLTHELLATAFHVSADIELNANTQRPQLTNCQPMAAVAQ